MDPVQSPCKDQYHEQNHQLGIQLSAEGEFHLEKYGAVISPYDLLEEIRLINTWSNYGLCILTCTTHLEIYITAHLVTYSTQRNTAH